MTEFFPAHIRTDPATGEQEEQSVLQHSRRAADYAASALHCIGLGSAAYLAGLLHDAGKCTENFATYIRKAANQETVRRGSVNHTFAAARYILAHWHKSNGETLQDVTAELIAYACGAHHGLFDCISDDYKSGFAHRMTDDNPDIDTSMENFLKHCVSKCELERLFAEASVELQTFYDTFKRLELESAELSFFVGMTARMLLSAVMEGDRRDTAEFMSGEVHTNPPDDSPIWKNALARVKTEENRARAAAVETWHGALARVGAKLEELPANEDIAQARRQISLQCKNYASHESGIYRLNVPTGGGKTLSVLRYALAHAETHQKRRILYVAPLLTILEQNAAVIRSFVQDDRLILEHHSNLVLEQDTDEMSAAKLLSENWDAPILITTLVQLLNTLFSGKTSAIRRLWALCDSVIVIDEIQSLPIRMLSQFNMAISFLSEVCGATMVLCSATQPCLEQAAHPLLKPPADIIPYDPQLWKVFQRTELQIAKKRKLKEIPDFIASILPETNSLLVVCNKKNEAEFLYRALTTNETYHSFHLSAAMCPAHRKEVLRAMQRALQEPQGKKVVCVSTQVIEAGVDISFGCVVRLCAGMDSVVQAAGRCNRNRESENPAPVYLIDCEDENLSKLPDILRAKEATIDLLTCFQQDSAQFDDDLTSDKAIERYYRKLYANTAEGFQDDRLPKPYDTLTRFSLLSDNKKRVDTAMCPECAHYFMHQAFKLAGETFTVFETDTFGALVPYGGGKDLIAELNSDRAKYDLAYSKQLLRRAKEFTVSLYGYQKSKLEKSGGIYPICNGLILALGEGYYDQQTGLQTEDQSNGYKEV